MARIANARKKRVLPNYENQGYRTYISKGMAWICKQNGISLGAKRMDAQVRGSGDNRDITPIGDIQLLAVISLAEKLRY